MRRKTRQETQGNSGIIRNWYPCNTSKIFRNLVKYNNSECCSPKNTFTHVGYCSRSCSRVVRVRRVFFFGISGSTLPERIHSKVAPYKATRMLMTASIFTPINSSVAGFTNVIITEKIPTKSKKQEVKNPVCAVFLPYRYQVKVRYEYSTFDK